MNTPDAEVATQSQPLWKRALNYHVVEILVGKAWVQDSKVQSGGFEEAVARARRVLRDRSVQAVRVTEHEIKHAAALVFEEEGTATVTVPKGMEDTGERRVCPLKACGGEAVILADQAGKWSVCPECSRTLPVR